MSRLSYARSGDFRFLWLKHITGVDLAQHCAKSLPGRYEKIDAEDRAIVDLELDGTERVHYLCGVAMNPYGWHRNAHVLWVDDLPGEIPSRFVAKQPGLTVAVTGARQLEINSDYVDPKHEKAGIKAYSTCRNWQAAWMLSFHHELLIPKGQGVLTFDS